ncbi:MAG: alpha/beta hydrolase [Rhodospirillaceae bacterium]|nr:alpha/beta hydrolase [Rhodospirillaceae bacterium]
MAAPWTEDGEIACAAGRIHYVALGSGEPVLLLHKLGGWVADWRHVAPALAENYRVIAMDMPGHGGSAMYGPPPYIQTLRESAAMIMAARDALGLGRCAVIGNSLGGCVAVVMAALWPELQSRLVLLSVALPKVGTREALAANDRARLTSPYFGPNGEPRPRPWDDAVKNFGMVDPATNDEMFASRVAAGEWASASERGVAMAGVADYLPRITAPTLLIYGANGGYKQFEAVGRAGLKDVAVATIPAAGSFAHQDNPAATARVLRAFLAGRPI